MQISIDISPSEYAALGADYATHEASLASRDFLIRLINEVQDTKNRILDEVSLFNRIDEDWMTEPDIEEDKELFPDDGPLDRRR